MSEKSLKLYRVNPIYCDYLREYDYRVPQNNDEKNKRPFIGIVFDINGINYYASLTSPKMKHLKMSNSQDFLKLDNGKLGAINFNNMIPINSKDLFPIDLSIAIEDNVDDIKYKKLLEKQRMWCNHNVDVIRKKAKKLHNLITSGKCNNDSLKHRCCDFNILEGVYIKYCEENELDTPKKNSIDAIISVAKKYK